MWHNSFDPTSDNLEILTVWHMRRVAPGLEVLVFTRIKVLSVKQADLRDMFKKASSNVCTSTVVVCHDHFCPTPSTCSPMNTPKSTEEDCGDPEPAVKISRWNTPLISCTAQL
jgi:hypothetical protein